MVWGTWRQFARGLLRWLVSWCGGLALAETGKRDYGFVRMQAGWVIHPAVCCAIGQQLIDEDAASDRGAQVLKLGWLMYPDEVCELINI